MLYLPYVFPTPIVTMHHYSVVSRRIFSALLNIPLCLCNWRGYSQPRLLAAFLPDSSSLSESYSVIAAVSA